RAGAMDVGPRILVYAKSLWDALTNTFAVRSERLAHTLLVHFGVPFLTTFVFDFCAVVARHEQHAVRARLWALVDRRGGGGRLRRRGEFRAEWLRGAGLAGSRVGWRWGNARRGLNRNGGGRRGTRCKQTTRARRHKPRPVSTLSNY